MWAPHVTEASNVIVVSFNRKATDGGKARIQQRREALGIHDPDRFHFTDSFIMDHADNGIPCDVAYSLLPIDCA